MLEIRKPEAPAADEREDFFSLDGTTYTIPVKVPPNLFMAMISDIRTVGSVEAQARMLDNLIGPAAVDALAKCTYLQPEDLKALMAVVQEKVAGAEKEYGGNS